MCINQEFIMKPNQTMTVNKLDQTYKLTESADYAEQLDQLQSILG